MSASEGNSAVVQQGGNSRGTYLMGQERVAERKSTARGIDCLREGKSSLTAFIYLRCISQVTSFTWSQK